MATVYPKQFVKSLKAIPAERGPGPINQFTSQQKNTIPNSQNLTQLH